MRVEWPTVALTVITYGLWIVAGAALWPAYPVLALLLMTICAAMHSSLVHENLHGHPTRSRLLNEALVGVNLGLIWPYRRYRETHLKHHNDARLTDPFEDPESYYKAAWHYRRMPAWLRGLLHVNNTLLGRMVLGPWLGGVAFLRAEARAIAADGPGVRLAWVLNLLGCLPVIVALVWWGIPVWLYVLVVVWGSLALISIRTFAEHRWHETPDGRTLIVERSPLSLLFLNNNLHVVHHKRPGAPWYRLAALYREHRDEWLALNQGYVYRNYWALFRAHAVHRKEPVEHPALYRQGPQP
ncbi:fatty acid desaturase [uncultured Paracoccus sp.]|uniref:fatty acid desaturase n=1 Tax=Paracoccus sp. M683 TaxID=2594268 RepID=UPI00342ABC9E